MIIPGRKNRSAYTALFGGLLFLGFSAIIIKSADAPGIVTSFYRMGIGTVVLCIPFVYNMLKKNLHFPVKGIMMAVLGGICFGIDLSLWSTGVVVSNATVPTIFANTAPVWVGIGSMLFFREKHNPKFWVGLVLAVVGISLVVKNDIFSANGILFGSLLGLASGLFYGTFCLVSQVGRKLVDTLSYLFITTFSSAVVLAFCVIIFNYEFTGYNQQTYLHFLAFGIGVQIFGWYLVNYSQGYLPASIVSPTLLGQPLITAFLALVLLHEHLTIWHISGGIIVITGIYVVHFSRNKYKN